MPKPTEPVLGAIRLTVTEDGQLVIFGTDYEVFAEARVKVAAAEPGACLVSGRFLADVATRLPERPVEVSASGTEMVIECGAARFTTPVLPGLEYPSMPVADIPVGRAGGDVFASALASVLPCAGDESSRPGMLGVQFLVEGDTITLTGTNGYWMGTCEFPFERAGASGLDIAIKATSLIALTKAAGTVAEVAIATSDLSGGPGLGVVGITAGDFTLVTRAAGLPFVKWQKWAALTVGIEATAIVSASELAASIRRTVIAVSGNDGMRIAFGPGSIRLAAGQHDTTGRDATPIEWDGEPGSREYTVDAGYLLDALQLTGARTVRVALTATPPGKAAGAILVTPDGDRLDVTRHLVMPIAQRPAAR